MGERKGTNKYYPPDFDPGKHKTLNSYHGVHALRERAKKIKQGILVIRFELPYNIWCLGCDAHVGMGVRYNAEKQKVGMYYTTPIYKFRMKCHLCDNWFEIQTDPKNFDYVILSGARRKEQRWDPTQNEQVVPEDKATSKKLVSDAMFKLEHGSDDRQKVVSVKPAIAQLADMQERLRDDYQANRALRDTFRKQKKADASKVAADRAILSKGSLPEDLKLVEESESDRKLARMLVSVGSTREVAESSRLESVHNRPLFDTADHRLPSTTPGSSKDATLSTLASISSKARLMDKLDKFSPSTSHNLGIVTSVDRRAQQPPSTTGASLQLDNNTPATTGVHDVDIVAAQSSHQLPSTSSAASTTESSHQLPSTNSAASTSESRVEARAASSNPLKLLANYDSDSDHISDSD